MQNYKMLIQYDGTKYSGWQSQEHTENTIQGKIQKVLERMVDAEVEVHGSGRTDAGAHAHGQVANVKLNTKMTENQILNYVNQYLPEDIAVTSVKKADSRFHSRLSAKRKTYVYRVWNSSAPNVFERKYVYMMPEKLDIEEMQKAAICLGGAHDFQAFCSRKMKKSAVRTVELIEIEKRGSEIRFKFTGDGFLYNMVRIMTGTLLEVGLGKRKPEDMMKILESKNREQAGVTLPPQGLTLWSVEY